MEEQHPHDYGCHCQQCKSMIAAITAENPDGTPFFSEAELYALSVASNNPMPMSDPERDAFMMREWLEANRLP
jgi:hypothetical protein